MNGDGRTIEVCREFLQDRCKRSEGECRYAHPPSHIEVFNGRVTCCVDWLRDRCKRENPPCRYLHPPQHLKDMLLTAGRSARSSGGGFGGASGYSGGGGPRGGPGDSFRDDFVGVNPYFDGASGQSEFFGSAPPGGRKGSWMDSQGERSSKSNTIEVCREFLRGRCSRDPDDCRYAHPPPHINVGSDNGVTVCMDFVRGYCNRNACRYFHPPPRLQSRVRGGGSSGGRKRSYPDDYNNGDDLSSTKRQATGDLYA